MSNDTNRRDLMAALPGLALLLAGERASPAKALIPPSAHGSRLRAAFRKAQRAWRRAWKLYRDLDHLSAIHGFNDSDAGRGALGRMEATLRRIDGIEAILARTPARNLAELRIKLELLSLDGEVRPEFRDSVMADVEALLSSGRQTGMIK